MESIIKSDIFFFITGIAVILLTVFWLVLLGMIIYYARKIIRDIKTISSVVKDQTERISEDADRVRENLVDDMEEVRKEAKTSVLVFFRLFNAVSEMVIGSKKGRGRTKKKQ